MAANLATLRAPSDSLIALFFPSPRRIRELLKRPKGQQDFWETLLQDSLTRKELERLAKLLKELARPLAQARSADELRQQLTAQLPACLLAKVEFFGLVLNALNHIDITTFLDGYTEANEQLREFIKTEVASVLTQEDQERLQSALYGVCTYSERLMRLVLQEGLQAVDAEALSETIEYFVKTDFLILTAGLMLGGDIRRWRKSTLSLIVQHAESLIDTMEEKLLQRDPELRRRLENSVGASISLETYRQRRGLE